MQTEKQRERLVELLNEATFGVNTQTLADHLKKETIESVAEYLMSNNVVVLPWKKGDTLYSVTRLVDGKLEPYQINVEEHKFKEIRYFIICENDNFLDSCWGKSLFADKEEAEKVLKERKNENHTMRND